MKALLSWLEGILWLGVLYGVVWLFLMQQGASTVHEPSASTTEALPNIIEGSP